MSTTAEFDNIIQIANDKTLGISAIKYGEVPSLKNVGTANDIRLEITIPNSEKDLEVEIGDVATGKEPSVKKRLENGKIYFDFVLPTKGDRGEAGPQGDAASIEIGRVSIGNMAKVENVGTKKNAILNFTLPYASGQGSYTNGNGGGSSGGDEKTAEELKNVTAGINRSAKATEELESTIADILSQITLMAEQNKVIISRVVNQTEQLEKTLGDRIDANKMSIQAITMTMIDRAMLDETKERMTDCERTMTELRGELAHIFLDSAYVTDKKNAEDKLASLQDSVDRINSVLTQLIDINDTLTVLNTDDVQNKANIALLQESVAKLKESVENKRGADQLISVNDLDASLKGTVNSVDAIRTTSNQNAQNIAAMSDTMNNLSTTVHAMDQTVADVLANYTKGDQDVKALVDTLKARFEGQSETFENVLAEIQETQAALEGKYAHTSSVYTKTEVDDALVKYLSKEGGDISGNVTVTGDISAGTFVGPLEGNADTASFASKATCDGKGNNIAETYIPREEFDALSNSVIEAEARVDQAASRIIGFEDQVADNARKIEELANSNENVLERLDSFTEGKVDKLDFETLETSVTTDQENNKAWQQDVEKQLENVMLKSSVIPEAQLDEKVIEKLNAIATNAENISQIQSAQEVTGITLNKYAENVQSLSLSLDAAKKDLSQFKQFEPVLEKLPFFAIEAMFDEYMPKDPEPENPEPETPDDPSTPGTDSDESNNDPVPSESGEPAQTNTDIPEPHEDNPTNSSDIPTTEENTSEAGGDSSDIEPYTGSDNEPIEPAQETPEENASGAEPASGTKTAGTSPDEEQQGGND